MRATRPIVQIGPISDDPAESVSAVNQAFVHGLGDRFEFVSASACRKHGSTRQARLNALNVYYLLKHAAIWLWNILRYRPAVAHYAVSSGWAMEKGLVFLGLARALGVKTVGHLHSGGFIDYWGNLSGQRRRFATRELNKLDAFVVLSENWRRTVLHNIGLPEERMFVVSNPIDGSFESAALQMPIDRSERVILSLGVMGREKGVLDIIAATEAVSRRMNGFRVQLAGPEREPGIRSQVMEQIDRHTLSRYIALQGSVFGRAKAELFRTASIFLLPSYVENFPLVLLEAAAAGHAIITTRVGAAPEFFADGVSAIFVEPGNIDQLSAAMFRLLEDSGERQQLARGARKAFLKNLGRSTIMDSLGHVYHHVLKAA